MKILIVEDNTSTSKFLEKVLKAYGECHSAMNGQEAVEQFEAALEAGAPFHLVCMDIMMPVMNGQAALKAIRALEAERGVKPGDEARVIMITALDDTRSVCESFFQGGATSYMTKPIQVGTLQDKLREVKLIS